MFDPISIVASVFSLLAGKSAAPIKSQPVVLNKGVLNKALSMTDATSQSTQGNGNAQGNNGQSLNPTSSTSASSASSSNKPSTAAKSTPNAGGGASNARFS